MLANVPPSTHHRLNSSAKLHTNTLFDNHLQPVACEHGNSAGAQRDSAFTVLDFGENTDCCHQSSSFCNPTKFAHVEAEV